MEERLDWNEDRLMEHVGKDGFRVRVCLDTMMLLVDAECLEQRLRGAGREDLARIVAENQGARVELAGRAWVPETAAKLLVLRIARLKPISELYRAMSAARGEAVRAIMAEQRAILDRIRPLNKKTIALLEEQLSYREPVEVN